MVSRTLAASHKSVDVPVHLPDGWQAMTLGDIAEHRREGVDPKEVKADRYVGLEHIDSGDLRITRWGSPQDVRSTKFRFYKDDVLYAKLRPYLDKGALADWEGICSTDILVIVPRKAVDAYFLAARLHHPDFLSHATANMTGVNHPRTAWSSLKTYPILLPPPEEQRVIASLLRAVQRTKEATARVIAATRELKGSLMRHLFTYGPVAVVEAENVELKETEIGAMPRHWGSAALGDLARIGNGSTPKRTNPAYWDGGTLPWFTSGKVYDVFIRSATEFVTTEAVTECHLPLVPTGSVLVAITGQGKTLGNAALAEIDAYCSQHLAYIDVRERDILLPEFLLRFCSSSTLSCEP